MFVCLLILPVLSCRSMRTLELRVCSRTCCSCSPSSISAATPSSSAPSSTSSPHSHVALADSPHRRNLWVNESLFLNVNRKTLISKKKVERWCEQKDCYLNIPISLAITYKYIYKKVSVIIEQNCFSFFYLQVSFLPK